MSPDSLKPVPTIVVFSPNESTWRWYEPDTAGRACWRFYTEEPRSLLEKKVRKPPLARVFSAFRCIRDAESRGAAAIAAHSQFNTLWAAVASAALGSKIPLLSFSFHFSRLPQGPKLRLMKWAYARVKRFTVHSEPERERYARHFKLPVDRFDLIRWGVDPRDVEISDTAPLVEGTYLCALGKDGRDYKTLVRAMEQLPELTLVLVAQPANLAGITMPPNVKVYCDIPRDQAMNILKYCEFMALPLETSDTSCGHITIVAAMFTGKPVIITRSSGIADYLPENYDAPKVEAGDVDGWVAAIRALYEDPARRARCAAAGEQFATAFCSHTAACAATLATFRRAGIPIA